MKIGRLGVRARLTLWYTLALALIIFVFSSSVYVFVKGRLYRQLDRQLDGEFSLIAGEITESPADLSELDPGGSTRLFQVIRQDKIFFRSEAFQKAGLPELDAGRAARYQTVHSRSGKRYRAVMGRASQNAWLTVVLREEPVHEALETLALILALALPLALVLAAGGGYLLAGRLLRPVAAMAAKAAQIGSENLSERLPVGNPDDEFGKLAAMFNHTLERLENAFERLRRFTADASHELRTPLTAIQSVGEVALQEHLDGEAYRDRIGSMLEETAHLTRLVEGLLLLTRADSGRLAVSFQEADIAGLVGNVVEDMRVLAEEKNQKLTLIAKDGLCARVDADLLRRAVVNILDNAVKYTPRGGAISVGLEERSGIATISVTDSGPGIAPEHREKVFGRFYRIDEARSREAGGAGLGLAIAKWAVEAMGGRIELESREGNGSAFRIVLAK